MTKQHWLVSGALVLLCGGVLVLFNRGSTLSADGHLDYFRREGLGD